MAWWLLLGTGVCCGPPWPCDMHQLACVGALAGAHLLTPPCGRAICVSPLTCIPALFLANCFSAGRWVVATLRADSLLPLRATAV